MQRSMLICVCIVFLAGIGTPIFSQNNSPMSENESLSPEAIFPIAGYPVNSAKATKHRRTPPKTAINGIRHLVPQQYPSIQAAINNSADGDTVLVDENTYFENINFKGKAIVVASYFIINGDSSHINNTIIDGSQHTHPDSGAAVTFAAGEDTSSVLSGFTIQGGSGTLWTNPFNVLLRAGGGVFCTSDFGATITNNRIMNNQISTGEIGVGGGVFCAGEDFLFRLSGNHISGNRVTTSAAVGGGGGILISGVDAQVYVSDNAISDNRLSANNGIGRGGGMYIDGSRTEIYVAGNAFERDTVVAQSFAVGGASYIWAVDSLQNSIIRENIFRENLADAVDDNGVSGGLFLFNTADILVENNLFENNTAKSIAGRGSGGGLGLQDSGDSAGDYPRIRGNQFLKNTASSLFDYGIGGGIAINNSIGIVSGNYFQENSAEGGVSIGGGMRLIRGMIQSSNNIYTGNSATLGAAVYASGTPLAPLQAEIINSTIVNNMASGSGGGVYVDSSSQVTIVNTILWENTPEQLTQSVGTLAVRYSDVQHGWEGLGNIDANPAFLSPTTFELSDASPCISAGIDSIEIEGVWYFAPHDDFAGNPRPTPFGSRPDIGAHESAMPVGLEPLSENLPSQYFLQQNYPNPFNPVTMIEFEIPRSEWVSLRVYNILGEAVIELVAEELAAGNYRYHWDGRDRSGRALSSGIYIYRLRAGNFVQQRKMILMR